MFQIISKRLHTACDRFQTEYVSCFKFLLSYFMKLLLLCVCSNISCSHQINQSFFLLVLVLVLQLLITKHALGVTASRLNTFHDIRWVLRSPSNIAGVEQFQFLLQRPVPSTLLFICVPMLNNFVLFQFSSCQQLQQR